MERKNFPYVFVEYYNELVKADTGNVNAIIKNPNKDHAEAANIFLYARAHKEVKIFCGDMGEGRLSSFRLMEEWARVVRDPTIELHVIAENLDTQSERFNLLRSYQPSKEKYNNHVYSLNRNAYEELKQTKMKGDRKGHDFHFTIVDGLSYRFEYDVHEHQAYLNFNDSLRTEALDKIFEKLKDQELTQDQIRNTSTFEFA